MRLELAGPLISQSPIVLTFLANQAFAPLAYIDMGYTNFDVISIGGGGGSGGGIDTANTGTFVRSYGGAGGGGGIHRIVGLLSALPASVPIVVGAGGNAGADHISNPALTTDGSAGGASSFNGTACQASGGLGGKRVVVNSQTTSSAADGGRGGIGGTSVAGGGALGGTAGIPTSGGPGTAGTAGADGTWNGTIGSGGGGGAGGVGLYPSGVAANLATKGGRGAYNPSDPSAYATGGTPGIDPQTGAISTVPGYAGGAKAALVSNAPTVYGSSEPIGNGDQGAVIIRLTAV